MSSDFCSSGGHHLTQKTEHISVFESWKNIKRKNWKTFYFFLKLFNVYSYDFIFVYRCLIKYAFLIASETSLNDKNGRETMSEEISNLFSWILLLDEILPFIMLNKYW